MLSGCPIGPAIRRQFQDSDLNGQRMSLIAALELTTDIDFN